MPVGVSLFLHIKEMNNGLRLYTNVKPVDKEIFSENKNVTFQKTKGKHVYQEEVRFWSSAVAHHAHIECAICSISRSLLLFLWNVFKLRGDTWLHNANSCAP